MAKKCSLYDFESDSSGDESLEQLLGLKSRPKRVKTVPLRYRRGNEELDAVIEEVALEETFSHAIVKCNQNGRESCVKTKDLSNEENRPLAKSDLVKGTQLLLCHKGKSYPVTFITFKGTEKSAAKITVENKPADEADKENTKGIEILPTSVNSKPTKKKPPPSKKHVNKAKKSVKRREDESDQEITEPPLLNAGSSNRSGILNKAQGSIQKDNKKQTIEETKEFPEEHINDRKQYSSSYDNAKENATRSELQLQSQDSDKELLKSVKRKVDRCEKMLRHIIQTLDTPSSSANTTGDIPSSSVTTNNDDPDNFINGKNVMRIRATGAYAFGFQLLDMLFSKEELGKSLLFQTKKSNKPALNHAKVERLISLVNKRFGHKDDWDEQTLVSKLNQKCRDSVPKKIKVEPKNSPKLKAQSPIPEFIPPSPHSGIISTDSDSN